MNPALTDTNLTRILPTDPEAATYRTDICGWVSRTGRFCGDGQDAERWARLDGSTHRPCPTCGDVLPRNALCDKCQTAKNAADYAAMPAVEWDGEALVYSLATKELYRDRAEVEDAAHYRDIQVSDLRLVLAKPMFLQLDESWGADEMPDDEEVPDAIADAIAVFNASVADVLIGYEPGDVAVTFTTGEPK